jgi:hypothetical protein
MALIAFCGESLFDDGVDGNIKTLRSLLDGVQVPSYCYEIPSFKTLDFTPRFLYYGKQAAFLQFGTLKIEPPATSVLDSPFQRGFGGFPIRSAVLWPPAIRNSFVPFLFFWKTIHPPG